MIDSAPKSENLIALLIELLLMQKSAPLIFQLSWKI